jgi:hypothetical protein
LRWKDIVAGRRVLLSYVERLVRDRQDAGRCRSAVNRWMLVSIAAITARRLGLPQSVRRRTWRFLSRLAARAFATPPSVP